MQHVILRKGRWVQGVEIDDSFIPEPKKGKNNLGEKVIYPPDEPAETDIEELIAYLVRINEE